ncbi:MAG TPA: PDZ domain-containing protein [Opitutaceae bacterium]|nr:PDZ domain-containing protein [Opitutaceae bacterium]
MNLITRLSCAAGLAVLPLFASSVIAADQPGTPEIPSPGAAPETSMRVLVDGPKGGPARTFEFRKFGGRPHEMESVTFLGVATEPVSETLVSQLSLPNGAGLVVVSVVPDSPAAAVLKPHDILLKLDDQILIDQRQLSVLVRNHHADDEVTVTYMRGGKTATGKVKLAKHDVPKFSEIVRPAFRPDVGKQRFADGFRFGPEGREEVDRVLSLMDDDRRTVTVPGKRVPGTVRATKVLPDNSNVVLSDRGGSLELTIKNGKKTLVAKDPKGAVLYSGPADTAEQLKAMPPAVRERFEKFEAMGDVKFRTDADFEGGKTIIYEPAGKTIMLRRTEGRPARPAVTL